MEIKGKGTIYQNQYGYQISDNQKQADGSWNNFYIPVSFPKSMKELPKDRDYIEIEGFTKPYKPKDGKLGISYMIMKWDLVKKQINKSDIETNESVTEDPYAKFGEEITLNPDDLPF